MKKVKEFLQSKSMKVGVMMCLAMSMMIGTAFAAEGETGTSFSTVQTAFETGFKQIASDALSIIAVIVPIALGVCGVIFIAKKAMSWFKSMSGG